MPLRVGQSDVSRSWDGSYSLGWKRPQSRGIFSSPDGGGCVAGWPHRCASPERGVPWSPGFSQGLCLPSRLFCWEGSQWIWAGVRGRWKPTFWGVHWRAACGMLLWERFVPRRFQRMNTLTRYSSRRFATDRCSSPFHTYAGVIPCSRPLCRANN